MSAYFYIIYTDLIKVHVYMLILYSFMDADDKVHNLVPQFAVTLWLKYLSLMTGRPDATMNSAQLVLKYLLMNEKTLHTAWRNRIYRYSSGSTFATVTADLDEFLHEDERHYTDLRDVRLLTRKNTCLCTLKYCLSNCVDYMSTYFLYWVVEL